MSHNPRRFTHPLPLPLALLALLTAAAPAACTEESEIAITSPERGAMLPAGKPVKVVVQANSDEVTVNDKQYSSSDTFEATLPAGDGLGFAWATMPDHDFIATRSWHQGTYRQPADWHAATLTLRLEKKVLDGDKVSIASLLADLLAQQELVSVVNNPLKFTVTLVPVTVTVLSLKAAAAKAAVEIKDKKLEFKLDLADVVVQYKATATLFSSTGTASYKMMTVSGKMVPTVSKCEMSDVTLTASKIEIKDSGGIPAAGMQLMADLFAKEINKAIQDAAVTAANTLVTKLLNEVRPTVGINFKKPIVQRSDLEAVSLDTSALTLTYKTQVKAVSPEVASKGHAVLERTLAAPGGAGSTSMAAHAGSALVNQYAFAAWDAGNLSKIKLTKAELEALGMQKLEFPYSNLDHVVISLLLPPLLSWDKNGPTLEVGGVESTVVVDSADDPHAWTAASIPVKLVKVDADLRLQPDPSRKATVQKVGFDKMNSLADHSEVHSILSTAVPGVVKKVFSSIPNVVLPKVPLTYLDKSKGPVLLPAVSKVLVKPDHWLLELTLSKE